MKEKKLPELAGGDTGWFTRDRFGMFIHWGLYSLGARHEWLMHREEIPPEEYEQRYFQRFEPDLLDPVSWAKAAAAAGMKYFVITTKHHEGFCLWDSKFTDYKATNTPAGRDLLRPLVEAFRAEGLRVGFYYSLLDWHHPHCFADNKNGPYRNFSDEDIAKLNKGRDQALYAQYMRDQVTELLTEFAPVDILWFDFSYPDKDFPGDFSKGKGRLAWESEKLYELVRELSPSVVVSNRLDLENAGDIFTPEQFQPEKWLTVDGAPVVWEACQTFSGSWGYHRDESSWRDSEQLIRTLSDCVSKGGNLLLNVGPTARGEFDGRATSRLREIGDWMKFHGRSIYGCTQAPEWVETPKDCRLTFNPETNRLYIHVFSWPYRQLVVKGLGARAAYAQLLNDASELTLGMDEWVRKQPGAEVSTDVCVINLPSRKPPVAVPVIEVYLK